MTQNYSIQMNSCLSTLASVVSDLTALYENSASGTRDTQRSVFLSHLTLQEYYDAEEKYTQELHTYTKKQFFEVTLPKW